MLPEDPAMVKAIDRAHRVLLSWGQWTVAEQEYLFIARDNHIFLPPEITSVIDVQVGGIHSGVFNKAFYYLQNGPRWSGCGPRGITYRGTATVFAQPECPLGLAVLADACEPGDDLWIEIAAADEYGRAIVTQDPETGVTYPHIRLPIVNGMVSRYPISNVCTIHHITKPQTLGAVHVYEYRCEHEMIGNLIASLAPHDITPSWQKYEVTGGCTNNAEVRVMAKRAHVPLYQDSQALVINDVDALAYVIQFNRAADGQSFEAAQQYKALAMERMAQRELERRGPEEKRVEFKQPRIRAGLRGVR